jgi:hypothetical protein
MSLELHEVGGLDIFGNVLPATKFTGTVNLNGQDISNGYEAFAQFLVNNAFAMPMFTGWSASTAGSGGTQQLPGRLRTWTGTTASSNAMLYTWLGGLYATASGGDPFTIDWDRKLWIFFHLTRTASDTEASAWVQLKAAGTPSVGDLAEKGIGIKMSNLDLYSESYGTARGSTSLNVTMTSASGYHIAIFHDPGTPQVKFYVDGVLKHTETTSANIPSGDTVESFNISIENGVTGGVNAEVMINNLILWQEIGG